MPLVLFHCIDVFFIWAHDNAKPSSFLEDFNKFHLNIKFNHETNKESIHFLDLKVRLSDCKMSTDLYVEP